jgi:hypothetical protein
MKKRPQANKYLFLLTICILLASLLLPGCGGGEPAEFRINYLTIDPNPALPGEKIWCYVSLENCGGAQGKYELSLTVDGEVIGTQESELRGGEKETLSYSLSLDGPGNYDIKAGNVVKTLTVMVAETYDKFDISFQYPPGMELTEKAVPYYSTKASRDHGVVNLRKPGFLISVNWMTPEEGVNVDSSFLGDILDQFIAGASEGDIMFESERHYTSGVHRPHTVMEQRYALQVQNTVNSVGVWWCQQSGRVFLVAVTRDWEGSTHLTDVPTEGKDYSWETYDQVRRSFRCHQ